MTPEQWSKVKELFAELAESRPEEREAALREVDEEIRSEVERLLTNDAEVGREDSPFQERLTNSYDHLWSLVNDYVFEAGTLLADRFDVVRPIGRGGMGEVYEAFDRALRESVAIKTIRLDLALDPDVVARFKSEVLHSRRVTHPNVCRVYDFFLAPAAGGVEVPFFTMELLPGPTLLDYVRQNGPFSPAAALPVAQQICEGLAAAHRGGILHRDLKSANIILKQELPTASFFAKITDFGLARLASLSNDSKAGDVGRGVSGTPPFIAPELLTGAAASPASDMYALGVILHSMIAGRYPDASLASLETISKGVPRELLAPPPLAAALPSAWGEAIRACLSVEPEKRPRDARQVAALLGGHPLSRFAYRTHRKLAGLDRRELVGGSIFLFGAMAAGVWTVIDRWPRPPFAGRKVTGLVEEFESQDAGAALGRSVRSMVRLALGQSPNLQLLTPVQIKKAAQESDQGAVPVRGPVALQLSRHARADVIIGGALRHNQEAYVLRLQAARVTTGEILHSSEHPSTDLAGLTALVERSCTSLRTALWGKEVATTYASTWLEPADTQSADALEMFTGGLDYFHHGEIGPALELLQAATRIDPDFAMAYAYQALVHGAMRRDDLAYEPASRAFALRDRVNQRQRLQSEAMYSYFCGDFGSYAEKLRALVALYPMEAALHRQLAQACLTCGLMDDALQAARKAVELAPAIANNTMILAGILSASARPDESLEAVARARKFARESPLLSLAEATALTMKGDYPAARKALDTLANRPEYRNLARSQQVRSLLLEGRLGEVRTQLESDILRAGAEGDAYTLDISHYWLGQILALEGRAAEARGHALSLAARESVPSSLYALRSAAELASDLQEQGILHSVIEKLRRIESDHPSTRSTGFRLQAEGLLQALMQQTNDSDTPLHRAVGVWPDVGTRWALAWNSFRNKTFQEAKSLFEQVIDLKGLALRSEQQMQWVRSLAMAGLCSSALGLREEARRYFAQFLGYWGNAGNLGLVKEVRSAQLG